MSIESDHSRVAAIDLLRGLALLGIFVMNIGSFAYPSIAYYHPFSYQLSSVDPWVFGTIHVLADQKFMALFSMLFGVSMLLFFRQHKHNSFRRSIAFVVRNCWLLIIGLLHYCCLWFGDILMVYALCSFLLLCFRKLSYPILMAMGLLVYLIPAFISGYIQLHSVPHWPASESHALTAYWNGTNGQAATEIEVYTSDYAAQLNYRLNEDPGMYKTDNAIISESVNGAALIDFFARALGMMLLGMALYKGRFFESGNSDLWWKCVRIGLPIGLILAISGHFLMYFYNWQWEYALFIGRIPNHLATIFMAIAYAGIVLIWAHSPYAFKLRKKMEALGKMALTGYLLQSLVASCIFYGYGLGFYASLNRAWQMLLVLILGLLLLNLAALWMQRFTYGPVEYLWRILTHFKWIGHRK